MLSKTLRWMLCLLSKTKNYFGVTLKAKATDNSGAVLFVVKNNEEELATAGGASNTDVTITVSGLLPNTTYNLQVIAKDDAGNEAEPVSVEAATLEAPAAAPKPSFFGKTAVAVFCDELDDAPAINIGGWGQSTQVTFGQLAAGDNVQYLSNMNFLGWELAPAVDATDMEYLHVDLYTTSLTSVKITPISPAHEGAYTIELTADEWNSVDIPLSAYATADIAWDNIFQFKFFDAVQEGGDLFIDNVYFYKAAGSGVENVQGDKVPCTKVLRNGMLLIEREGVRYTVTGMRVK